MAYASPLKAYEAAVEQAAQDHYDRCEDVVGRADIDELAAVGASEEIYDREVAAARAVYDCAWAAITRSAIAYDRAAYERRHGTLDGFPAFRAEDAATARAELMAGGL